MAFCFPHTKVNLCLFSQMLGTLITGMLVPFNDPDLLRSTGNAAQSPYVIAISRAGIKTLPGFINGCILTSAFSAGNSFLFCSSRILYGLALRGQAPRIFTYCTNKGLPIAAIIASSSLAFLSFMNVKDGAAQVFKYVFLNTLSFTAMRKDLMYPLFPPAGSSTCRLLADSSVGSVST